MKVQAIALLKLMNKEASLNIVVKMERKHEWTKVVIKHVWNKQALKMDMSYLYTKNKRYPCQIIQI